MKFTVTCNICGSCIKRSSSCRYQTPYWHYWTHDVRGHTFHHTEKLAGTNCLALLLNNWCFCFPYLSRWSDHIINRWLGPCGLMAVRFLQNFQTGYWGFFPASKTAGTWSVLVTLEMNTQRLVGLYTANLSPGFKWLWSEPENCYKSLQISCLTLKEISFTGFRACSNRRMPKQKDMTPPFCTYLLLLFTQLSNLRSESSSALDFRRGGDLLRNKKRIQLPKLWAGLINLLKTKRRLLYLKTQFVPRSKHFSSRL